MRGCVSVLFLSACAAPAPAVVDEAPAAPVADVAQGLPLPPPGVDLSLAVGDVHPGESTVLTITDADPNETVMLFRNNGATGAGPCPAALGGVCLELNAPKRIGDVLTD